MRETAVHAHFLDSMRPTDRWIPSKEAPSKDGEALREAVLSVREPFFIVEKDGTPAVARGGTAIIGKAEGKDRDGALPLLAHSPACRPESLGDQEFCRDHSIRYPYCGGSMAQGISSVELVEALCSGGMLAFYGAAGMPLDRVESAIDRLMKSLGPDRPFGFNLIHSPNEPLTELSCAELYIRRNLGLVEASAFMDITLPLVLYRLDGIHSLPSGEVITPRRIMAKVSRVEVASKFFAPPPASLMAELVAQGRLTEEQARMAEQIPMAEDLTAEADSGGHTDNRPALSLVPTMMTLRDRIQQKYGYKAKLRVGAAGGISTPASAAAAFSMGAAYIMTGSVNQACLESGTSDPVRAILAQTEQADVTMAPAADMFEMGVKVQVVKRGTMFPMRAARLYSLFQSCEKLEDIPPGERTMIEKNMLLGSFEDTWNLVCRYFTERDPEQIEMAERNPKHKMALIFRFYLGQASRWAISADPKRKFDYQIWCGPAMGSFNEWTKGTFLQEISNRKAVTVARNLLHGAAVITRLNNLRYQGVYIPELNPAPLTDSCLDNYLQ